MKNSILLIEDDNDVRERMTELLEFEGYTVAKASNGREGLSFLDSCTLLPDLILLDLAMPTMNGHEFRAHQLRDPKLADIPVVVLSGMGKTFGPALCAEPGIMNVLQKPVDLDALLNLVELYCG